ncbi:MAG: efflux RND transporter periplasmic adaptor subunit, partial [Lachnospiraceae bacterium]|nr:efflux RND transporter periplasmic adaptor subunit [Lachnospiraceae bacterium]
MKKFIKPAIIILLVLLAAGGGLYYYLSPDTLKVVVADKGTVSPILSGTGKIEGDRKVTVYSDVAGVIEDRYVEKGERVKAGDQLVGYAGESQQNNVDLASTDVEYSEKILDAATDNRAKFQKKYNDAAKQIENCKAVYALLEVKIMSININDHAKAYQIREQQKAYQNDIYKMQEEISEKQSDLSEIEADLKAIELKDEGSHTDAQKKEVEKLRDR